MDIKKWIFFVVLLVSSSLVWAADPDFTVELEPVNSTIKADQVAEFDLIIRNNLDSEESFRVYTQDYSWDVGTKPIRNPLHVDVEPESNKTTRLYVDPLHSYDIGVYDVSVHVASLTSGYTFEDSARVSIHSSEREEYVPTVLAEIDMDDEIDPREKIPIKIHLNNRNILDFENITILLESNTINDEIIHHLDPKESKIVEITEEIDPLTIPQKETLQVTILSGEEVIAGPIQQDFAVQEYLEKKQTIVSKGWFRTEKKISITSNNPNYQGKVDIKLGSFEKIFTSSVPEAREVKIKEQQYLVWPISLQGNSMTIRIVHDYRIILYGLISLVIIALIIYYSRTPILVDKTLANIDKKEGGISTANIMLTVKNRSKKPIKDVHIVDKIPNIADIEKEVSIGTLQPTKILRHEKKGSIVRWVLDDLDAGEERVIRYKIRSKLTILGGFRLSPAVAKFRVRDKERIAKSNPLSINP